MSANEITEQFTNRIFPDGKTPDWDALDEIRLLFKPFALPPSGDALSEDERDWDLRLPFNLTNAFQEIQSRANLYGDEMRGEASIEQARVRISEIAQAYVELTSE